MDEVNHFFSQLKRTQNTNTSFDSSNSLQTPLAQKQQVYSLIRISWQPWHRLQTHCKSSRCQKPLAKPTKRALHTATAELHHWEQAKATSKSHAALSLSPKTHPYKTQPCWHQEPCLPMPWKAPPPRHHHHYQQRWRHLLPWSFVAVTRTTCLSISVKRKRMYCNWQNLPRYKTWSDSQTRVKWQPLIWLAAITTLVLVSRVESMLKLLNWLERDPRTKQTDRL